MKNNSIEEICDTLFGLTSVMNALLDAIDSYPRNIENYYVGLVFISGLLKDSASKLNDLLGPVELKAGVENGKCKSY